MERRFWQFMTHRINMGRDLEDDQSLAILGANSWEAVTVVPAGAEWYVFLKREMDEETAQQQA